VSATMRRRLRLSVLVALACLPMLAGSAALPSAAAAYQPWEHPVSSIPSTSAGSQSAANAYCTYRWYRERDMYGPNGYVRDYHGHSIRIGSVWHVWGHVQNRTGIWNA